MSWQEAVDDRYHPVLTCARDGGGTITMIVQVVDNGFTQIRADHSQQVCAGDHAVFEYHSQQGTGGKAGSIGDDVPDIIELVEYATQYDQEDNALDERDQPDHYPTTLKHGQQADCSQRKIDGPQYKYQQWYQVEWERRPGDDGLVRDFKYRTELRQAGQYA